MQENYIWGIDFRVFVVLVTIGGGVVVAVIGFGLKAAYDYLAEKRKNTETNNTTYNQTLFLLIKLYELVIEIKENIKTYEDRENKDVAKFLAKINELKDSFTETIKELSKIDPYTASALKYQEFLDNISNIIDASKEAQRVENKKKKNNKLRKPLTKTQLRARILGLNKISKRLYAVKKENVEVGLTIIIPMLLTISKQKIHLIARKIGKATFKETIKKIPLNDQDFVEFKSLIEKAELIHQKVEKELEVLSKQIDRF